MIELDIKIEARDLYDYMLCHTYSSASGILGSCVGAFLVVAGAIKGQWIFVIAGAIVLLYLPWTLFLKSRQQILLTPAFKKPLHYLLNDEGITVSQDGQAETQEWSRMVKAVSTPRSLIIYTSRTNATILPRRQLGDQQAMVIESISTHMPPARVKIKS